MFGKPSTIFRGLRVSERPTLFGNTFNSIVASSVSRPFTMRIVIQVNGVPWIPTHELSFMVLIDHSPGATCSPAAAIVKVVGKIAFWIFSNSLSP